ncbi:MAG: AAA family ATPase [Thermodesulfobacteriota bacterium]|nr:AAA family ATPase [Thermodesulfobacteriota bacterium]
MLRFALEYLKTWKSKPNRKPLVIRGARQVGKTYLVRLFAEECFDQLVEINFERAPEIASLFASNDPRKIVQLLELQYNIPIRAGSALLFLDEIQARPEVLTSLRYFYEELPELHVIAAGSLLEFAIEEPTFSMPVGRIEYLHLGPMQFEEFLLAAGKDKLVTFLNEFSLGDSIADPLHGQLMDLLRIFLVTGGMPEAVAVYLNSNSWQECESTKHGLIATFQDDFNKYAREVKHQRLQLLFKKIPSLVGSKFKYVNVNRDERSGDLAKALNLLYRARIAYPVYHSSCSGIPLGATVNPKKFKVIFLDVGLMSTVTGLNLLDYEKADVMRVNAGAVCEQYIGQHLLYSQHLYCEPEVYYWIREKKNSSAEVDYVISEGTLIVPVEVKAGKSGTLKSLHLFLREKYHSLGVRFNTDIPSVLETQTAMPDGLNIPYRLLSLPLYMVGQTRRIIRQSGKALVSPFD